MLNFDRLWTSFPHHERYPCRSAAGEPHFDNQCAVRLASTLIDAGISIDKFPGVRCWHGHDDRHILRAEELANWLKSNPGLFGPVEIRSKTEPDAYSGRRGIIFCRNFWGTGNQGDHIDLWNLTYMAGGYATYINRAEEVWFWECDATTTMGRRSLLRRASKATIRKTGPRKATSRKPKPRKSGRRMM